jgi:hypothetical protein
MICHYVWISFIFSFPLRTMIAFAGGINKPGNKGLIGGAGPEGCHDLSVHSVSPLPSGAAVGKVITLT